MTTDARLRELLDEFGFDLEIAEADLDHPDPTHSDTSIETVEAVHVESFAPGEGAVSDRTYSRYLPETGTQTSVTVKTRPECPSCGHIVSNPDEPNNLAGGCSECGVATCPQCTNRCRSCGTILCPGCTTGHGLKEGTLCRACRRDIVADVEFERQLEGRELEHKRMIESTKAELQEELEHARFELSRMKQLAELDIAQQRQELEESLQRERIAMEQQMHEKELALKQQEEQLNLVQANLTRKEKAWQQRKEEEELYLAEEKQRKDTGFRDRETTVHEWDALSRFIRAVNSSEPEHEGVLRDEHDYRYIGASRYWGGETSAYDSDWDRKKRRNRTKGKGRKEVTLPENYPDPDMGNTNQ